VYFVGLSVASAKIGPEWNEQKMDWRRYLDMAPALSASSVLSSVGGFFAGDGKSVASMGM